MNLLFTKFETDVESYFKTFFPVISAKFKINDSELLSEWEKFKQPGVENNVKNLPLVKTCPYKMIKGKNEGKNCNKPTKDGSRYCSAHIKFEETEQKEKKIIPKLESKTKFVLKCFGFASCC